MKLTNKRINAFFEEMPEDILKLWPYDFDEYETFYDKSQQFFTQAGMVECLKLTMTIKNEDEEYIVVNTFSKSDGNFDVEIDSLYASIKPNKKTNFAKKHLEKLKLFLHSYDKTKEDNVYNTPAQINLFANSEKNKDGLETVGGYIWANHGFDFKDDNEIITTQNAFFNFAKKHNIKINKRQLKKMTKPSDFANIKLFEVVDKFGKTSPIGKAFLLQHSWRAKWDTTKFINSKNNYFNNLWNSFKLNKR